MRENFLKENVEEVDVGQYFSGSAEKQVSKTGSLDLYWVSVHRAQQFQSIILCFFIALRTLHFNCSVPTSEQGFCYDMEVALTLASVARTHRAESNSCVGE